LSSSSPTASTRWRLTGSSGGGATASATSPLVNYLPNPLRNRLVPHARAYTAGALRRLLRGLPVRVVFRTVIFPGYDRIARRSPALARALQAITYALEHTPLRAFGLSHFWVLERELEFTTSNYSGFLTPPPPPAAAPPPLS
jgi:hypothetical protein